MISRRGSNTCLSLLPILGLIDRGSSRQFKAACFLTCYYPLQVSRRLADTVYRNIVTRGTSRFIWYCHFWWHFYVIFSNQNRLQNLKLFRLRDFFRKFIRQLYEQLSRWCFRPTGDALRIDQKLKIRISTWIIIVIFDHRRRSESF